MSKKRQDLELELRKLDIDRRDVDVRLRSIEQSPRNQRILKGDFSRPPPREGDTRRFVRGRGGTMEEASTPAKRLKEDESSNNENGSNVKEEDEKEKEHDTEKEHAEEKDDEKEESLPSVLSAVVVNEEPETKEESSVKPERAKRKLAGNAEISKRDKRIFSSLLLGSLKGAQNRLKVDKENVSLKKKEELEAKVSQKISQRTVGIREKEAEYLAQQRDQERKLRDDIVRKEEIKRRELDELIAQEHEELLGNFIRTQTEPYVYFLPASHTEKSKKLLAKTKEFHDTRIADGSVMQEKELDQVFIAELFKTSDKEKAKEEERAVIGEKGSSEKGDKDKEQTNEEDTEPTNKDTDKAQKERGDSPAKKNRKKKDESSSSSSDSSDSD